MGFKQTIRRMAGSGLAALTAIGLLGTALVAAPAATAATVAKTTAVNGNVAKTVTPTGNANEYRIDMSVTGSGSSENARTPTDYIVMIDESTSMNRTDSSGVKRSDYARDALKKLVSGILTTQNEKRPESKRDRVAVIHSNNSNPGFSPLSTGVAFHDKASDFDSLTVSEMGDTPWAMWLAGMRVQLGKARADAQKIGLFITDGSPSSKWYSGRTWENADGEYDVKSTLTEDQNQSEYSRSLMQAKTMGKDGWDAFYNIGIDIASQKCDGTISSGNSEDMKMVCLVPKGDDFPKSEYDKYGSNSGYYNYLYWLKTGKVASNGTVAAKLDRSDFDSPLEGLTRKMAGAGVNAHISTPSGSGLSDAISSAMKDVTLKKTMRNATLTDPLSKWVEPVGLTDGKADGITVTKDGKTMTSGYTASYDAKTRTVTVGIPGNLADGSVYKASFKVRLNGTALADHQTNAYPDTGDPDTGATSARKKGYASNGNATAAWTNVSSRDGKETLTDGGSSLPKPVVQVTSHTVTFDANGGSTVASQTVDDKAKAVKPANPTRSGWTLDGWYLDGVKYDFNTPVTRDITLKAGWRKTDVTTAKADLHKRLATGSKNGQYKLTLDVKGTGSPAMRNTTVTDPLSKWVDPAGLADGKGTGITVTKDGKAMTSGYTATYDAKTRTVKVVLPGDLADGATYAVSFEVVLSNAARQAYMQSGAYPDTGDADTGLNAGKKGYFTNGNATLTWDAVTTVNGAPTIVPSKAAYPKPVATWASDAPSVLVNHLPGTGGTASLIPVIAGMGIAIAIASAWAIRRRLA